MLKLDLDSIIFLDMSITFGSYSHKGKVKKANEDHYSIIYPDHQNLPYIVMVTDGVGGRAAGEMASFLAIKIIANELKSKILSTENIERITKTSLQLSNKKIYEKSINRLDLSGMCTTIVIGIILGDYIHIFSVGDSRVYLFDHKDILTQITTDHTWINEMISSGQLKEKDIKKHPHRHRITRAIGISEIVDADYYCIPFEDANYILFCTDGLTEHIPDKQIEKMIKKYHDPQICSEKLVSSALSKGGTDNVTVVVTKF